VQPEAYRKAKTSLPYIVTGCFSPCVRNRSNFAYTEHFIIDIDKVSESDRSLRELKSIFSKDPRVLLLFTSPGNDGLKILFRLSKRITDTGFYSTFYRIFAHRMGEELGIHMLVDRVTHDVTRCCFMSFDPDAYINTDAIPIDTDEYARMDDPAGVQRAERISEEAGDHRNTPKQVEENGNSTTKLEDEVLARIRQRLSPSMVGRKQAKEHHQPTQLLEAMQGLTSYLAAAGISISEQKAIHYGRQLRLTAGVYWAEVNLFHGKNSFRAVMTTKTGSNAKLAELSRDAIQSYFDSLTTADPFPCPVPGA
jgi:hypothetical protein